MKTYRVECTGDFAYSEPVNTLRDARKVASQMLKTAAEGVRVTILCETDTVVQKIIAGHKRLTNPPPSRVEKTNPRTTQTTLLEAKNIQALWEALLAANWTRNDLIKLGRTIFDSTSQVEATDPETPLTKLLNTHIVDLEIDEPNICNRAINCLHNILGLQTVSGLLKYSERDLLRVPNCGRKTVKAIKETLARMNLRLKYSL